MSLWEESFEEAILVILCKLPLVLIVWLVATFLALALRTGESGQYTLALFTLMGTLVFVAIFGIIFWTRTFANLRFFVLKENQGYAKKRIAFRELFRKQIIFGDEGDGMWF